MDSLPLSQDEINQLQLIFSCTGDHDLYGLVKKKVITHRSRFHVKLVHIETHTKSEAYPLKGFTTNDIRLVLCKFDDGTVLGIQTEKKYACTGTFLL